VAIFYQLGIMQRLVSIIAKGMNFIMRVSGAEALSNVASAFVGQVEAQVMIRPYLKGMTKSELLASMSGSLACIAGGILVVYVSFGAKAEYLLAASMMAAPGALVISKIVWPETEPSETKGVIKLEIKKQHTNLLDAIGDTINNVNAVLDGKKKKDRPGVIITIMTDGEENASRRFNNEQIKAMVKAAETADWTFVFLGANIDSFSVGSTFGMSTSNSINYSTSNMGATMASVSSSTTRMRAAKMSGTTTADLYSRGLYTDAELKAMK
jgi:hypothetical protein